MKKNYFSSFVAALMLFVAMPASAEVSSMADLFGKWQFTATIETTEAGAAHADKFKSNCEVTIAKAASQYFMADISGFAGANYSMSVSGFDAAKGTFEVSGPNSANYGLWDGYLAVSNAEGAWPWADYQNPDSEQFGFVFSFNGTEEITVADFTIVSQDWGSNTATILAHVKNVKMTPIELDVKDTSNYPDLTGLWTWEGGLRTDTVSLKGFTVEFQKADETKENWNATFTFGDYEPFTLAATFDGSMVTVPHDTIYFDKVEGIRIGTRSSSTACAGNFTFSYNSKTSMSLYDYIYVRKDVYSGDTLKGGKIYQVFDGYITRENPDAYDWSGIYNVSVADAEDLNENDGIVFPAEFDMVVEKRPGNLYVITEMLGYKDLSIGITPSDDDKYATINLGGYSGAMLEYIGEVDGDYAYHVITDANAEATSLTLTKNDDDTFSFGDFSVSYKLYYAGSYDPIASFVGAKATKKVFDWAGEYTLTATVEAIDATATYASEFDVEIQEFSGVYYITKFDGDKVYSMNYGGIPLTVADKAATAPNGKFVGGAYPNYVTINGVDAANLNLTMDAAGNIKMADFYYTSLNYDTNETANVAIYSNVVLTRKAVVDAIESIEVENKVVEGIFDLLGRKLDVIKAPGIYIVNGKKVLVK